MRVSELRIGNYVSLHGILVEMTASDFNFDESYFKPITLKEEWLLKFGFEKNLNSNNIIYYILAGKCLLEYNLTHNIADIVKKVHLDLFIEIEYVHQLQNLYFALTNEELTYEQQK